jgi:pyruvate,water dikinase
MRGIPACGGRARGRATILGSATEAERLSQGDVLVTRQTDPGWGPVFFLISGLVIERGGMLSHGAIIAREFGIPCVVGVKGAMARIRGGATLEVNGDAGVVHVVD